MGEVELVIKIPEEKYRNIQSCDWKNGGRWFSEEWRAIHNGTPLPKGHGRLIDADTLIKNYDGFVGYFDEEIQSIKDADTIIEADKNREEGKKCAMAIRKEECPFCKSLKYKYVYYTEDWGKVVERHGFCPQCGYKIEQAYSGVVDGFEHPIRKGMKGYQNKYIPKNIRKRKRYKRKFGIKYDNKDWILSYI